MLCPHRRSADAADSGLEYTIARSVTMLHQAIGDMIRASETKARVSPSVVRLSSPALLKSCLTFLVDPGENRRAIAKASIINDSSPNLP